MNYWKRMSTGRYVDLGNLKEEDVNFEDIEVALNYIFRFTGHHKNNPPLTVAQHSLLCLRLAQEAGEGQLVKLGCLTHDFAEAYLGDVSTPLKRKMGKWWKEFASPVEKLVNNCIEPELNNPDIEDAVKFYDRVALDIERRTMWKDQRGKDKWPIPPEYEASLKEKGRKFRSVMSYGHLVPLVLIMEDVKEGVQ